MFIPGSIDAVALDLAVRASLRESIGHLISVAGSQLGIGSPDAEAMLDLISSRRVAPGIFGRYYKLVLAIEDQDFEQGRVLVRQMRALLAAGYGPQVRLFTDADLGDEKPLYAELIDPGPKEIPWILPPPVPTNFLTNVDEALGVLAVADQDLRHEIAGLVTQIVGAGPYRGPGARPFSSASSLMLWGLLVINAERNNTVLSMIQAIVHESAHLLLFAHSIEEPLVTNAVEERFMSPLRKDPRPMDGVFHATFVTARLHYINRILNDRFGRLSSVPFTRDELNDNLATFRRLYFGGLETVQTYGKLTKTGNRILQETIEYMKAA